MKKGFQAGKGVVSGAGDDVPPPPAGTPAAAPAAPAGGAAGGAAAPAAPAAAAPAAPAPAAPAAAEPSTTPPSAQDINAAGPAGTAPAKAQTGAAGAALAKTDAVTDNQTATKAGETVYAQVKANIDKLDAKGKGRILQLLKQSLAAPAPGADPRDLNKDGKVDATEKSMARNKAKPAAPAAAPAAAGAGAFDNMAKTLTQEPTTGAASTAAAPAAAEPTATATDPAAAGGKLTAAQQAAKVAELKASRAAGASTGTAGSGFKQYTKDASSEKVVGANRDGSPKIQQIKASKINYGNALSEALAQRVEMHKQKMFETGLSQGTTSIFRK
jgi:hypothetical protein